MNIEFWMIYFDCSEKRENLENEIEIEFAFHNISRATLSVTIDPIRLSNNNSKWFNIDKSLANWEKYLNQVCDD